MYLSHLEYAEKIRLLDDMEKYYPGFKREDYEDYLAEQVMGVYRNYINKHLPFNSESWLLANKPDDGLIYKDGLKPQVRFVQHTIYRDLFFDKECIGIDKYSDEYDEAYDNFTPLVISTHKSKSVLLPVFELNLESVGVKLVLRNNFYDWNVSVESEKEIFCDFKGLITEASYADCYCQGFPKNRIYGQYEEDRKRFTVCLSDDYKLYTFMWILRDYLYQKTK